MMMKISRGIILIIMGIILYLPVAKVIQIFLPSMYGSVFTLLLGTGFLIAGAVYLIKERMFPKVKEKQVQTKQNNEENVLQDI